MIRLKRILYYFGNIVIFYVISFFLKKYILGKVLVSNLTNNNEFLSFTQVQNNGAAFNLFAGSQNILVIFAILIILSITIYLACYKLFISENLLMMTALFSAGIIGNAVERFTLGYVEDFIKINLFNFPVFNINDIMITIGAIFIAFVVIRDKKQEFQDNKDAEENLLYGDN